MNTESIGLPFLVKCTHMSIIREEYLKFLSFIAQGMELFLLFKSGIISSLIDV